MSLQTDASLNEFYSEVNGRMELGNELKGYELMGKNGVHVGEREVDRVHGEEQGEVDMGVGSNDILMTPKSDDSVGKKPDLGIKLSPIPLLESSSGTGKITSPTSPSNGLTPTTYTSPSRHRPTVSESQFIPPNRARTGSDPSSLSSTMSNDDGSQHATLKIKKVIGTTAQSQSSFCSIGNTLAYTAGAGAIVAQLDHSNGRITNQRFYCTSTKMVQAIQASMNTSHHFNINKLLPWSSVLDQSTSQPSNNSNNSISRDSYGFFLIGSENTSRPGTVLTPIFPSGLSNDDSSSSGGSSPSIINDYPSSSMSRSVPSAKDKMKTTSSLALSSDGKLLAVGETGHQPRIFIYSTANDSSPLPLAILNEHRFGIKSLAFSPCGRFLASLGTTNDGFLHIWSLSLKEGIVRLHSTNRCISIINDLKWIGSNHVTTVGVRHVRVWTVESQSSSKKQQIDPKPAVLQGRNVVLGEFSQATFTTATPLSENMAIVTTEAGDIATLENNQDEKPLFQSRTTVAFEITAVDIDISDHKLWVAGTNGIIRGISLEEVLSSGPISPTGNIINIQTLSRGLKKQNLPLGIYGLAVLSSQTLVTLKGNREISIQSFDNQTQSVKNENIIVATHSKELYGIRALNKSDGEFLTWSADGIVRFWTSDGVCESETAIRDFPDNASLTISCTDDEKKVLVVGDSLGVVKFIDMSTKSVISFFQAHGSRVVDLDYRRLPNGRQFFVSSSRDRTIQIFLAPSEGSTEWTLHQTLEAHKGNIIATRITQNGQRIISCAADRTVNIHKIVIDQENNKFVGFISERIISLKSPPCDMCLDPQSDKFVVSSDKQIFVYRVSTGDLVTSYKTIDNGIGILGSGGESVNLGTISLGCLNEKVYLAGMGNDKSVRLYEHPSGILIGSDWGHSEGISGLTWVYADGSTMLASSGNDGSIFLWNIKIESTQVYPLPQGSPISRLSPTRKILSKTELAKFMPVTSTNRSSKTPSPARKLAPSPISTTSKSIPKGLSPSAKIEVGSGSPIPRSNPIRSTSPARQSSSFTRSTPKYGSIPSKLVTTGVPVKSPSPVTTPTPTNNPRPTSRLRQSIVPRSTGIRTLSASKSFPALSSISKGEIKSNSNSSTNNNIKTNIKASNNTSSNIKNTTTTTNTIANTATTTTPTSLDELRQNLISFRSHYTRNVIKYEKQNKDELKLLTQELKETLRVIDPSFKDDIIEPPKIRKTLPRSRSATTSLNDITEPPTNDSAEMQEFRDMFEQFGDKFFSIVASKFNAPNENGVSTPSRSPSPIL